MAYEDDEDYPQAASQTSAGLASNPLMPMGDPLAYARVGAAPEASVPAIHTAGMAPQRIAQAQPINVPNIPASKGGSDAPTNDLQPTQQDPSTAGPNMNSLQGLLQMKGLADLAAPAAATPGVTYTPGGAVAQPGAGAGPGRVPTGASIAKAAAPYQDMVNDAAKQNGVDPGTLTRLLYQESQFNPKAKSPAGAQGIGQFMPATAKDEGVDVNDPKSSIYGSAKYLRKMTDQFGNDQLGMAAYNWGPGSVLKWLKSGADLSKVPAETRNYVQTISGRPLAPNQTPKAANVPSAAAAPMEAMVAAGGGGFAVPGGGQDQREQQVAPAPEFGQGPKPGQMSPHGGPYISSGGQIYATDGDGKIVGPAVTSITTPKFDKDKTEDKPKSDSKPVVGPTPSVSAGVGPDQGTPNLGGGVSQPAINPDKVVPGATPPVAAPTGTKPEQNQPETQVPSSQFQLPGMGQDPMMQKLWRYMLIKSLFPQLQFKNIGYDPWKVHKFGQEGGY
jgi:soluble lytic murein transglycosylase-like protein